MKVRTLLAVTLATTTPAAAGPEHHTQNHPAVSKPAPRATPSTNVPSTNAGVAATPRTLPTGSPACGNVQAKGEASRREVMEACLRAEAAKAKLAASPRATNATATSSPSTPALAHAPTPVAAKPRMLPTGSPACGNVQAKIPASKRAEIEACLRAEAATASAAKVDAPAKVKK